MHETVRKSLGFGIVVALHVVAFWGLSRLVVFHEKAPDSDTETFTATKVAVSPPPIRSPEAPAGLPVPSGGAGSSSLLPAAPALLPITVQVATSFTMSTPKTLPVHEFATTGTVFPEAGQGSGDGSGLGSGDLNGLSISKSEHLLVVIDESGSMDAYSHALRALVAKEFPDASIVSAGSARGDLTGAGHPGANGNLYAAVMNGLAEHQDTTAVYMMSDFEDGDKPADTQEFMSDLRAANVKLYIYSVEKTPYGLEDFCNSSGGDYRKIDPHQLSQ